MIPRQSGSIVTVGSIFGRDTPARSAAYGASKAGIVALTQAAARELGTYGIRVNCVSPGTADTPWVGRLLEAAPDPAAERKALEARQPHGRLVTAEEVAASILFLADPANGSTSGTTLPVDSGMHDLLLRPAT